MSTQPQLEPVDHRGRRRMVIVLALAFLSVSALGARFLLPHARSPGKDSGAAPGTETSATPRWLACLGYVDVEKGVLPLTPSVPGRVVEVAAKANETGGAGATLLRLEDDAARADVQQAEESLRAAQAQLPEARQGPGIHQSLVAQQQDAIEAARHDLAAARILATHKAKLAKQELIRQEEADAAREQVAKAEAAERAEQKKLRALEMRDPQQNLARAEAEVRAHQAVLDKARYALRQCSVSAPGPGEVLGVLVQTGDVFGPQSREPALMFVPEGPRIVRAEVEQEFAPRVAVGQRAEVSDDALHGPTWTGRVARLSDWFAPRRTSPPDVTLPADVRTLECIIELDAAQPRPRIGQRVRVKLYQE